MQSHDRRGATKMRSLQANKTFGDLEPNISLLKIYASIGFRAEELSQMEEEFEILNVRGRNDSFLTHVCLASFSVSFTCIHHYSRWFFHLQ